VYKNIMVATDGTKLSRKAVEAASKLLERHSKNGPIEMENHRQAANAMMAIPEVNRTCKNGRSGRTPKYFCVMSGNLTNRSQSKAGPAPA